MSLSFRKSVSLGPLRLNLSKSGLGASVGVRGARVGTGPRGAYVQVGAGGISYRQSLAGGGRPHNTRHSGARPLAQAAPAPYSVPSPTPYVPQSVGPALAPIQSGDVDAMQDASGAEVLAELNAVAGRVSTRLLVAGLVFVAFAVFGGAGHEALATTPQSGAVYAVWTAALTLAACVPLFVWAWRRDARRLRLDLHYDVTGPAADAFATLAAAVDDVARSSLVRRVDAEGATSDWKRNAGAGALVNAVDVRPSTGLPPRVTSNIAVPILPAGRQTLYLFPDRVLVRDGGRYGAVSYPDVLTAATTTRFIEARARPQDAVQVGTTWRFVNKNGGPDRRFNNNVQIPIYHYGELDLTSATGLRNRFHCSRPDALRRVADALHGMARAHTAATVTRGAPRRR